jgi:hypothetical protein
VRRLKAPKRERSEASDRTGLTECWKAGVLGFPALHCSTTPIIHSLGIIRTMRFLVIPLALAVGVLCQGCVAFRYPTPTVRGSVVDAATKKPIADVKIEVHNHSSIHCRSAADGSFDLPSGSAWRACFLIPGDYLIWADVCFKADGYQTVTKYCSAGMGRRDVRPVVLEQPVELKKEGQP